MTSHSAYVSRRRIAINVSFLLSLCLPCLGAPTQPQLAYSGVFPRFSASLRGVHVLRRKTDTCADFKISDGVTTAVRSRSFEVTQMCLPEYTPSSARDGVGLRCWVGGFVAQARRAQPHTRSLSILRAGPESSDEGGVDGVDDESDMEVLRCRLEKMRLERRHVKDFLQAKPRKLPYKRAVKWVQHSGRGWKSQKEWEEWIDMGEKKNSYIPSRPDVYYSSTGDWISWEHFLGTEDRRGQKEDERKQGGGHDAEGPK